MPLRTGFVRSLLSQLTTGFKPIHQKSLIQSRCQTSQTYNIEFSLNTEPANYPLIIITNNHITRFGFLLFFLAFMFLCLFLLALLIQVQLTVMHIFIKDMHIIHNFQKCIEMKMGEEWERNSFLMYQ